MLWMTMLWGCGDEVQEAELKPAPVAEVAKKAVKKAPTRPPPPRPPTAMGQVVTDLEVDDWVVSNASITPEGVTLVVFWELWCPHCRNEVPKLEALHGSLGEKGLTVVGLTRLSRDTPRADVAAFVQEQGVHYPVGVGGHDLANRLGVRGIPSGIVIKDGIVVWSGHPARLDEEKLKTWL